MNIELNHHYDDGIEYWYDDELLFRYTYRPRVDQRETPKPSFHPLCTLRGNCVTNYRPTDHLWHHGLAMTCAQLSGQNFWGGPTYVRDEGYRQLDNNGAQRHVSWKSIRLDEGRPRLEEALAWVTFGGQKWLDEARTIVVERVDLDNLYWVLSFETRLTNCSGKALAFGSPTTEGRPAAGYGGFFWRGPRSFTGGRILIADGTVGEEKVMGKTSPWLAFFGTHDGSGDTSTLVFIDSPSNPRYPTKWFARHGFAPLVSFAFTFDEEYHLADGAELALSHHILIADGTRTTEQIEGFVEQLQ